MGGNTKHDFCIFIELFEPGILFGQFAYRFFTRNGPRLLSCVCYGRTDGSPICRKLFYQSGDNGLISFPENSRHGLKAVGEGLGERPAIRGGHGDSCAVFTELLDAVRKTYTQDSVNFFFVDLIGKAAGNVVAKLFLDALKPLGESRLLLVDPLRIIFSLLNRVSGGLGRVGFGGLGVGFTGGSGGC